MSQPVTQLPPQPEAAGAVVALGGTGLVRLAAAHRHRQQALALLARNHLRRLWRAVDPSDPQGSWGALGRRATALLTVAQAEAARGSSDYVAAALALQDAVPDPVGLVASRTFAGVAADGRALDGLLGYPAFEASAFVDQGMDPAEAVAIGGRHLDRIAASEVADAARVSTGVAVVNDRRTRGYIRMLGGGNPCSRCVILAGQWYEWNSGFQRHPQCSCVHVPAAENVAGDVRTEARNYFDGLTEAQQNATFTAAGAEAIREGADLARVVNARRGVYIAGGRKFTTEATTRRGTGRRVRLMPEQIYIEAKGNRAEAIRLLKLHGYIL